MPAYKFYSVDAGGRITNGDWIEADSDEEVILKARSERVGANKVDIWHKTRLVGTIMPDGRFEMARP